MEDCLYHAFYAYFALEHSKRPTEICLLCGTIPSVLYGDGNEDISTRVSKRLFSVAKGTIQSQLSVSLSISLQNPPTELAFFIFPTFKTFLSCLLRLRRRTFIAQTTKKCLTKVTSRPSGGIYIYIMFAIWSFHHRKFGN